MLHSPFAKASKPGSGPRRRSALRLASSGSLFGESRARVATRAERQGRGGDVGGAVSTAAAVGVASAAGTSVPAEGGRAEAGAASAAAAAATTGGAGGGSALQCANAALASARMCPSRFSMRPRAPRRTCRRFLRAFPVGAAASAVAVPRGHAGGGAAPPGAVVFVVGLPARTPRRPTSA